MNKPLTPKYSSFKSLLQSKLKGYWRVQSLEKLKSKVHKGDLCAQRLKKKIERNSSFDHPDFIQFKRCASFTKLHTYNQSLQCDLSSSDLKNFFFTQTQKKIAFEKEQRNNNLLLSICSNNERELNLYNSLPFVVMQSGKYRPRTFKEVIRESRLLKNNDEYFKKAILFFKQINNSALKNSFQRELSTSQGLPGVCNDLNKKDKSNMLKDIQQLQETNNYPNSIILFKKMKIINNQQIKRNDSNCLKARGFKDRPIINQSNSSSTRKTIKMNQRNNRISFHDKFDKKASCKSNSRDIKPSNNPFIHKEYDIPQANRRTIMVKSNYIKSNE